METETEQMLARAQSGDLKAQSALVRSHHRGLRAYVSALCGNSVVADDLAQETFLRAMDRLDRVIDPGRFPAFLRGIGRNVVREHFRARRGEAKKAEVHLRWIEDQIESRNDIEILLSDDPRLVRALKACIERLPDRSRKMVVERYFEERDAREIGSDLGLRPVAVRNALLRIRRNLYRCISESVSEATPGMAS